MSGQKYDLYSKNHIIYLIDFYPIIILLLFYLENGIVISGIYTEKTNIYDIDPKHWLPQKIIVFLSITTLAIWFYPIYKAFTKFIKIGFG